MRRHQAAGVRGQESVVNEQYHAPVLRRADDPPRRLQDLVHAGVAVGIVKTRAAGLLKVISQLFLAGPDLRQTGADNGYTDQALPCQVYALAKDAAQHGKPEQGLSVPRQELRQKLRALALVHGGFLAEGGLVRVAGGEILPHLLQVAVTGEEGQVVPRLCSGHHGQQIRHFGNAVCPVLVAGADLPGAPQPHIGRVKRAAQCHGAGVGQTAQILVVTCRGQRSTEQHRRTALGKVCRQEVTGVQAEHSGANLAADGGYLQNKVVVKRVCHPQPGADIKVQLQQCVVGLAGGAVLVQPNFQRLTEFCQRTVKVLSTGLFKVGAAKAAVAEDFFAAVPPFNKNIVDLCQRIFQAAFAFSQLLFCVIEGAFAKAGAVHIPGAAGQIVGFIDEKQVVPRRLKKTHQVYDRVKEVVVVSHHYVTP